MTELVFRGDAYQRSCEARVVASDERGIVLDRTVFYPLGGGQAGDVGTLRTEDGRTVSVVDTVKGAAADEVVHVPAPDAPALAVGAVITAEIDWTRRHRLMRMHTCLHLLSAIVPGPVTGGSVTDGKGRLDFDLAGAPLDKEAIQARLDALVAGDHPVSTIWITDEELAARPELVKTMSVKPPTGQGRVRLLNVEGVDLQPCGGTHVRRTSEISAVIVTKIESKGRQNRRVNLALA